MTLAVPPGLRFGLSLGMKNSFVTSWQDEILSTFSLRQSDSANGRIEKKRWRFRSFRGTALQGCVGRIGSRCFNLKVWCASSDPLRELSQFRMKKLLR